MNLDILKIWETLQSIFAILFISVDFSGGVLR